MVRENKDKTSFPHTSITQLEFRGIYPKSNLEYVILSQAGQTHMNHLRMGP